MRLKNVKSLILLFSPHYDDSIVKSGNGSLFLSISIDKR
jgi:hypothetical protein